MISQERHRDIEYIFSYIYIYITFVPWIMDYTSDTFPISRMKN